MTAADRVYNTIVVLTKQYGFPPTWREIANFVGYSSHSSVRYQLDKLRDEGRVEWEDGHFRTIRVKED